MTALEPAGDVWESLAEESSGKLYRSCANGRDYGVCNWYVPVGDREPVAACRLNDVIPDTSVPENRARWHRAEIAKRRLVYTIRRLDLPTDGDGSAAHPPLRVRLLADGAGEPVLTGHLNGAITINIAEADDAERERRRRAALRALPHPPRALPPRERALLLDRLIGASPRLEGFRALFGDERQDYQEALQRHHVDGPPGDWPQRFISGYAGTHPWEDWAETWAHYLHMTDMLETAACSACRWARAGPREPHPGRPCPRRPFDTMLADWFPLTYVLNSLNRGLGLPDGYPFVIPDADREAAVRPRGDHRGARGAGSGPRMMAGCPA